MSIGAGYYAHKVGYNALYGDGHAQWYGDPNERFIWQGTVADGLTKTDVGMTAHLGQLSQSILDPTKDQGFLFWHLLDEAVGVDVGAW